MEGYRRVWIKESLYRQVVAAHKNGKRLRINVGPDGPKRCTTVVIVSPTFPDPETGEPGVDLDLECGGECPFFQRIFGGECRLIQGEELDQGLGFGSWCECSWGFLQPVVDILGRLTRR